MTNRNNEASLKGQEQGKSNAGWSWALLGIVPATLAIARAFRSAKGGSAVLELPGETGEAEKAAEKTAHAAPDCAASGPAASSESVLDALYRELEQDLRNDQDFEEDEGAAPSFEEIFEREFGASGYLPQRLPVSPQAVSPRAIKPAAQDGNTDANIDAGADANAEGAHAVGRVLITHDEEEACDAIAQLLAMCDIDGAVAHGADHAIETIIHADEAGRPFDLLLIKPDLPLTSGYEAARILRREGITESRLPIIALAESCDGHDILALRKAGMQGVLATPVGLKNALEAFNRWLPHRIIEGDLVDCADGSGGLRKPCDDTLDQAPITPANPPEPVSAIHAPPLFDDELELHWQRTRANALLSLEAALRGTVAGEYCRDGLTKTMDRLANISGLFGEVELGERAAVLQDALKGRRPEPECRKLARAVLAEAGEKVMPETQTATP